MSIPLTRAYSTLEIKSVDEDLRIIEGIASTPSTDRMGDIVEPEGAKFALPLPLLWQHQSDQPIGHVLAAKVSKAGISVRAQLASVSEPGALKDRIDLAWQSIKSGLVRGLSIGFRATESADIQGTWSTHFLKWEWLELSAVTIPANAEATIQTIKSLCEPQPASGTVVRSVRFTTPRASGARADSSAASVSMKTYQEQIKDLQAGRAAKSAELEALQTKVTGEGRTKDQTEREQFDTLSAEIDSIDAELKDLARLESQAKASVVVVEGKSAAVASAARSGVDARIVSVGKMVRPAGIGFARMVQAKAASFLSGGTYSAYEIAKARWADDVEVVEATKGGIPGGTTTDTTWASPLVYAQNLASEFIEFLRPQTIIGRIPGLRHVPFNVRVVGQNNGGTAYWVGQSKPKPLTRTDFTATSLGFAKIATIAVISDELARFSSPSAESLVRDTLASAVIERADVDFIDPTSAAVANVNPASITYGLTPYNQSGTGADDVRADLATLLGAFLSHNLNPANAVLIMPNSLALVLSLLRNDLGQKEFPDLTVNGGTLEGIPVVTSQYAANPSGAGNLVILLNASEIFLSDDGQVTVDVSREASLQMLDNPTNEAGTNPVATSVVSMFQTNNIAIRAERYINWAKRRSTAVVYMDDVSWGGADSPTP